MGFSTALWEAISGKPWPYDEEKANKNWKVQQDFMRTFGGITPGHGTINVSKTANPAKAAELYKQAGYNVVGAPSNTANTTDINTLLIKAHQLHGPKLAPTATRFALDLFHKQLNELTPEQRAFLADPKVSDANKIAQLANWTGFKTLDDVNQYAVYARQDMGKGAQAFGGWKGYFDYLKQKEAENPYRIAARSWTLADEEALKKYGVDKGAWHYDPAKYAWYFVNQQWKQGVDDPKSWAHRYRAYKGDYEGFRRAFLQDLMYEGKIGQPFDIESYIGSGQPSSSVGSGGAYRYGGTGTYAGVAPPGYGNPQPGGGGVMYPQSMTSIMTDLLNMMQLENLYQPSKEALDVLMHPYKSTQDYQEALGMVLNQLSKRGVVNSTLTTRAMEKLGRSWMERARELQERGVLGAEQLRQAAAAQGLTAKNLAARVALDKYLGDLNAWLRNKSLDLDEAYRRDALAEKIRESLWNEAFAATRWGADYARQRWLDEIMGLKTLTGMEEDDWKRVIGAYGTLNDLYNTNRRTLFSDLFRLWNTMISGRYQIPSSTTTYSGGVSPFISFLSPVIGDVAEAGMDAILNWAKGIFSNPATAATTAASAFIAPGGIETLVPGFPGI